MSEAGYQVLAFLLGGIVGGNVMIWLNGMLVRELSALVKANSDLLIAQNKAIHEVFGNVLGLCKETSDDPR